MPGGEEGVSFPKIPAPRRSLSPFSLPLARCMCRVHRCCCFFFFFFFLIFFFSSEDHLTTRMEKVLYTFMSDNFLSFFSFASVPFRLGVLYCIAQKEITTSPFRVCVYNAGTFIISSYLCI